MTTIDRLLHDNAAPFEQLSAHTMARVREICDADGSTFVLRDGSQCFYVDEDSISPLWKGQRFPIEHCISGWAMTHAELTEVGDIYADPRIPVEAYRPTFIRSLAMAPMGDRDPVGAIGVYWSRARRTLGDDARRELIALANAAGETVRELGVETAPWAPSFIST